jgi:hypothetical protein
VFLFENGTADPYYRKLTSPKQSSLIIGTSKAAEGINPKVLNERMCEIGFSKIFNYSFTIHESPFGIVYLNSIKRKLKNSPVLKYFIITVDPWSISRRDIGEKCNIYFEEEQGFLADLEFVNMEPNIFYLLKNYERSFYDIITFRFFETNRKLDKNGYLIRETKNDSLLDSSYLEEMIVIYEGFSKEYSYSIEREKILLELIEFLKQKGRVYLIRMPVHNEILRIEECFFNNFDRKIASIGENYNVPFKDFNHINSELRFKDGIHLDSASATILTKKISDWIFELEN